MEEIFLGALDRHFLGGRCVGAFDPLNISEGVWKKNWLFSEGKREFRQFLRGGAGVGTFDL